MTEPAAAAASPTRQVLRNASYLVVAQLLAAPMAVLVYAVAARTLGVAQFGVYFQAGAFVGFVMLLVEWGQPTVLTGQVATGRERAGEWLGSAIAARLAAGLAALLVLPLAARLAGYDTEFVQVFALLLLAALFGTMAGAAQDVYRGFERTDFAAASMVGWQLLSAMVMVPALLLGATLVGLLWIQVTVSLVGAAFVLWMAPRLQVPRLSLRLATIRELWQRGHVFLVFALVLAVQPTLDALFLSRLGTAEEMGWFGATRKLMGVLAFPASALIAALYPTLCRLRTQDMDAFHATAANAIHLVGVIALPLALGCGLFPELGVAIFGLDDFAPALDNLRVMSVWLLLLYFTMPIGSTLTAAGRQRPWTLALLGGASTGVALDPFLIPWAQETFGNGGLGVCIAAVAGEVVTLTAAVCLLPRGLFASMPRRRLLALLAAGAAMAASALVTAQLNRWVAAGLSVLAYALVLVLAGGRAELQRARAFIFSLRR